jgi:Transposase DDE domain
LRLTMEVKGSLPEKFEKHLQGFDWCALFGAKPEKVGLHLSKAARAELLQRTALAALEFGKRVKELLVGYDKKNHGALHSWCAYLDKVLGDEFEIQYDESGTPVAAKELPNKDKGDFRLISATDPDASLRVHGSDDVTLGYNIQVAATPSGFVCETKAYTGATSDQTGIAPLISEQIKRQKEQGEPVTPPEKLIYDKAASTGKVRAEVTEASEGKTQLVARSTSHEQPNQRFSPYNFKISQDSTTLTCPNGQTSTSVGTVGADHAKGCKFTYFAHQCWGGQPPKSLNSATPEQMAARCPLWERCRAPKSGINSQRTVFISEYRDHVIAAEAYNQTEQFKQDMKQRPGVERVIFELTHYNNARRCRRHGLQAAHFQANMSAMAYNLKLLVRKLNRAKPRRNCQPLAG